MSLLFTHDEILKRSKALTFNDVLLMPRHSEMDSRHTPKLQSKLSKNITLDSPIIASNMDTITEAEMVMAMSEIGATGILHRFIDIGQQVEQVKRVKSFLLERSLKSPICASIGVKEGGLKRAQALVKAGVDLLTIDIAHGDSVMMIDTLSIIKREFPHIDVIAGNTASYDGVKRLVEAGADAIKVGIGPGSMCTTRLITGCGVPQLTAIAFAYEALKGTGIPLIADGGIKHSGDMVKAFAAGADTVMVGSLLSGTIETPGEVKNGKKLYRGMASKSAQVSWRGGVSEGLAPEGEATQVNCKGTVKQVISEITGGIKSGMTYLNAPQIEDIRRNAQFMEMTASGFSESRPHGL